MVEKQIEDSGKIELILLAAQKRFGRYGFGKTTMSEIADDIHMSKASLYYYFPDKESIFKAVILREQESFISQIEKMLAKKRTASQQLLDYVVKRHAYFKELVNLAQLRADAMMKVKPLFKELNETFVGREIALLSSILKQGQDDGEFKKLDTAYYAELFNMTTAGLRVLAVKNKDMDMLDEADYAALEKHTSNITKVFIKGIKAE